MKFHNHSCCRNTCGCNDNVTSAPGLGRVCGPNVNTEGIDFAPEENNLVYLDKVFSYNNSTACPILFDICTAGPMGNRFNVDLTMEEMDRCGCGCGCGCGDNNCVLDPDATFRVDSAVAFLDYIDTRPPGNIDRCQVTIDGEPVDAVNFINGRYMVSTAEVSTKIQRTRCLEAGLPTKTFFLLRDIGPFDVRLSFELEGVVNTNGRNCRFKAVFTMRDNAPDLSLPSGCPSSFAIPNLALPCTINGVAPDVFFQFGGVVKMVNPEICIHCSRRPLPGMECDCCDPCCTPPQCSIALSSNLVIEPSVQAEVIRPTLFCLKGCEAMLPCSPLGQEAEEECPDPFASPCSCGTRRASLPSSRDCNCEHEPRLRDSDDDWRCNTSRPTAFQFNGCNGCTW